MGTERENVYTFLTGRVRRSKIVSVARTTAAVSPVNFVDRRHSDVRCPHEFNIVTDGCY